MIKVNVQRSAPVYFGCFYRATNGDNSSLLSLHTDLGRLFNGRSVPRVILAGDFNLPSIDWATNTINPSPQYGKLTNETMMSVVHDYFLDQLVLEPTRLQNTLDLLLTNAPDTVSDVEVIPGISDHEAITCNCNINIHTHKTIILTHTQ